MMSKPILCLDFDGVIHGYESGWQGADKIPDAPVPGAFAFLFEAIAHFRVAIFSSRSGQEGGIPAMQSYMRERAREFWEFDQKATWSESENMAKRLMDALEWPMEKPPAMVTIDDRALTFTGTWPDIHALKAFQPWNKAPAPEDEVWSWWAGHSDEEYQHQCTTRDEAVYYAQNECNEDGGHIVEAMKRPLDLQTFFDADEFLDRANDSAYDYQNPDGDPIFEITLAQQADLEKQVRLAIAGWQAKHGLTFMPWTFTHQRNEEFIPAKVDEE